MKNQRVECLDSSTFCLLSFILFVLKFLFIIFLLQTNFDPCNITLLAVRASFVLIFHFYFSSSSSSFIALNVFMVVYVTKWSVRVSVIARWPRNSLVYSITGRSLMTERIKQIAEWNILGIISYNSCAKKFKRKKLN